MELSRYFMEYDKDIFPSIVGHDEIKKQVRTTLITGRHLIIVGPPGVGKTTLAKSIAKALPDIEVNDCGFNCSPEHPECPVCKAERSKSNNPMKKINHLRKINLSGSERFVRIQGSSDLTVEDLIGYIDPVKALKYGPYSLEAFVPGKIFRANQGVLFFDEINRAPEKVQNSLLQVLEENEVTIGSYKMTLPARFILIATMNPEDSSTERLSDVFLDRFDMVYMDYPETEEDEREILKKHESNVPVSVLPVFQNFMVALVRSLRMNKDLEKKPSVRATIGLLERAKANAFVNGRKSVSLKDIESVYISVLSHRIRLNPSVKYVKEPEEVVKEEFKKVVDRMDLPEEDDVP